MNNLTNTAEPSKPSNALSWAILTVAVLSLAALLPGCVGPSVSERYPGGGGPIYHEDGRRIEVQD